MPAVSDKDFAEIYCDYAPRIKGFIRTHVRDVWIADDLTQETFIRARQKMDTLNDPGKLKAWLFRIAYNICLDHYRSVQRKPERVSALLPIVSADPLIPQNCLEQQQMSRCIHHHIRLLPKPYRTVLWLFDVLDFTHQEIADVLDTDMGSLKVRLHRARRKLKETLKKGCEFERDERNIFICVPKGDGSTF